MSMPRDIAQRAAVTMISTVYSGEASLASTVARAGVQPGATHASQAAFISENFEMSASQNIGGDEFRLVGSRFREKRVDLRKNIFGLFANAFAFGRIRHLASEIDHMAVNDSLAHARSNTDACNGHVK